MQGVLSARARPWLAGLAALVLVSPQPSLALPVVGLLLKGEPEQLGLGGAPFRDLHLEALRLERPALLAGREEGYARLRLDVENTLDLRAGEWAGTRAYERKVVLESYLPLGEFLPGVRLGAFAAVEVRDAHIALVQDGDPLFLMQEERALPLLGLVAQLPHGFALAAGAAGSTQAPQWQLEGRWNPWTPLTLWVRHLEEGKTELATIPGGATSEMHSPPIHLPLDFHRTDTELGAELSLPSLWARGAFVPGVLPSFWFEGGVSPWERIELRAGMDQERIRVGDRIAAAGTGEIARLDLRLERLRGYFEADFAATERDTLLLHATLARLRGATWADEVGTNAAQAFLHVDTDLGLLLEGGAEIEAWNLGIGWKRDLHPALRFAFGAQYLQLRTLPSAISLVSFVLDRALAEESVERISAHLLAVSAFLEVPLGQIRLGAGLGQIVPLALVRERGSEGGPPSSPAEPGAERGWFEGLVRTLQTTRGGSRVVVQATVPF